MQSEQVFAALKPLDVETAFVRFAERFLGMARTGGTDGRIAMLNQIQWWNEKDLQARLPNFPPPSRS